MSGLELRKPTGAEPRFFYGYVIVAVSFLAIMVVLGTYLAFGVFLKPVLTEFGWTTAMISGAFSLSMLVFGLLGIGMGGLNDKFGPRIVLLLCGILLALGYVLMSQISALWHLYLLYGVLIGTGVGCAYVPIMSTIARWFVARRTLMTGIVSTGTGIGGLIIPLVATRLILAYNWRISYIVLGCTVLVIVLLVAQFMRRDPSRMEKVRNSNNPSEQQLELKTKGLSFIEAVCSRKFWLALGMEFCLGFCAVTIIVHIVPHAIELGNSATSAASILATLSGCSAAGRVLLGGAGDRIGNRMIFIISFILMAAALFWLMSAIELWQLYLFAVVFGFAYGGIVASESPLAAALFGLSSHGLIYGVFNFVGAIGASLGPFLAGYIFDATGSYQLAFLIAGAVGILGLIFSAVLRPVRTAAVKI